MRTHITVRALLAIAVAVVMNISAGAQQSSPLTLAQAVAIAIESSPVKKAALADANFAKAAVGQARSAFLPRVEFSETATRGNDPVYAFGTKLRQGRFTQADFALDRLNFPDAIGNFSTRVGGQWNVFDSFQTSYQVRRSKAANAAAQRQLTRTEQELVYRVIDAYYGVLLAARQVDVAEQTVKTARALAETSTAKVEAGTAVDADALSARVVVATRQQEFILARNTLDLARTQLETALGVRLAASQQPTDLLKERTLPPAVLEEVEALAMKQRPDLQATGMNVEAQHNSVKAAKAAFGPRLNLFGSWQADNPSFLGNGSTNWTTGAELRIDLFAGEKHARLSMEKAALSRAEANRQIMADNVRLEVRGAYLEHDAARQMLDVARTAVAQAGESLRIIRDRYDTGLVTITELLRAEDADRASRTNYWQSVYRYVTTYAALQLATGDLNAQSVVVTQ